MHQQHSDERTERSKEHALALWEDFSWAFDEQQAQPALGQPDGGARPAREPREVRLAIFPAAMALQTRGGKAKIQTAVRALQPQELFALTAENERLLNLEKDLAEREAKLKLAEAAATEEAARLRAQNDELRQALDLAMLNGGGGDAELRAKIRELEARHVLERSEDAARVKRAALGCLYRPRRYLGATIIVMTRFS